MFIRILRGVYKRLTEAGFADYVRNVLGRTDNVPAYSALQTQITAVKNALQRYEEAREAAADGGKALTYAKNAAKLVLMAAFDAFVVALERLADGDVQLILNAGLEVVDNSHVRYNTPLEAPTIVLLESRSKRGELYISLTVPNRRAVRLFKVQVSYDGRRTWVDLQTITRIKSTIRGINGPGTVDIQVIAVGKNGNESPVSFAETRSVL